MGDCIVTRHMPHLPHRFLARSHKRQCFAKIGRVCPRVRHIETSEHLHALAIQRGLKKQFRINRVFGSKKIRAAHNSGAHGTMTHCVKNLFTHHCAHASFFRVRVVRRAFIHHRTARVAVHVNVFGSDETRVVRNCRVENRLLQRRKFFCPFVIRGLRALVNCRRAARQFNIFLCVVRVALYEFHFGRQIVRFAAPINHPHAFAHFHKFARRPFAQRSRAENDV